MRHIFFLFSFFFFLSSCLTSCIRAGDPSPLQTPPDSLSTIWIVGHGWHTGIVFESGDLPDSILNQPQFPDAAYIEFGWGDRTYYMDPEAGYGTAVKAALWPTAGIMHVVGFDRTVDSYFSLSESYSLQVDRRGRDRIISFVLGSFTRSEENRFIPVGEGLYGKSHFYESDRTYIFPKTCNVWTAGALKEAGFGINPLFFQHAGTLMDKVRDMSEAQKE